MIVYTCTCNIIYLGITLPIMFTMVFGTTLLLLSAVHGREVLRHRVHLLDIPAREAEVRFRHEPVAESAH